MHKMKGLGAGVLTVVVILGIVVGGVGLLFIAKQAGLLGAAPQIISTPGGGGQQEIIIKTETVGNCPDNKQTTGYLTLRNVRDATASTTFDATGYLYKEGAGQPITVTDTTAGSVTLDCNTPYTLKLVRTNADLGDNSRILALDSANEGASVSDGTLTFTPTGQRYDIGFQGSQHGLLEFRLFDSNNNAFNYDDNDATNTDYEADGIRFNSTTSGTAATEIATGEDRTWKLYFRANNSISEFNDQGTLILIEGATTVWKTPVCNLDSGTQGLRDSDGNLVDIKGSGTTTEEEKALSAYEYMYLIPADVKVSSNQHILTCTFDALDGVNPTTDIEIDFAARGAYLSVDGKTVKVGANDDTSSYSTVFTLMDTLIDIS